MILYLYLSSNRVSYILGILHQKHYPHASPSFSTCILDSKHTDMNNILSDFCAYCHNGDSMHESSLPSTSFLSPDVSEIMHGVAVFLIVLSVSNFEIRISDYDNTTNFITTETKWITSKIASPQILCKMSIYELYFLHVVWIGDSLFSAMCSHLF